EKIAPFVMETAFHVDQGYNYRDSFTFLAATSYGESAFRTNAMAGTTSGFAPYQYLKLSYMNDVRKLRHDHGAKNIRAYFPRLKNLDDLLVQTDQGVRFRQGVSKGQQLDFLNTRNSPLGAATYAWNFKNMRRILAPLIAEGRYDALTLQGMANVVG